MAGPLSIRRAGKTVYILGAGFSQPAGIPVLSRFIPKAFEILKRPKYVDLLKRFAELVGAYRGAANRMRLDADNLEILFCLSDLSERGRRDRDRSDLISVIARTVFESCKCHNCGKTHDCASVHGIDCCVPPGCLAPNETISAMNHSGVEYGVCIYKAFLSHIFHAQRAKADDRDTRIDDLDSVITFNYDLVLEAAMKDVKDGRIRYGEDIVSVSHSAPPDGPSIQLTAHDLLPRTLYYLKIHGSLNWVVDDTSNHSRVAVRSVNAAREGRSSGEIPLVPPTWKRSTRDGDIYSRLLSEAIEHLRTAGRIVIIGYSMPDTDTYFKYVLATALDTPEFPKIEVWDVTPRSKMMPRLASIFGLENVDRDTGPVRYEDGGLSGFVKQEADRLRVERNP
jgi:hypothetical protein